MKFSRNTRGDIAAVAIGLALGLGVAACGSLTGVNGSGKVCNAQQQCTSYQFSQEASPTATAASSSPAPDSSSPPPSPTPQGESASASIPGATPQATDTLTPPPSSAEAAPTSSPVPQTQFDSSLHRCKQSSDTNTLISVSFLTNQQPANDLFTCMQIPPDQMRLIIYLLVWAVYDALTHQQFNPPAQYQGTTQAAEAQDVVAAYRS